jgi:hypothetical protein
MNKRFFYFHKKENTIRWECKVQSIKPPIGKHFACYSGYEYGPGQCHMRPLSCSFPECLPTTGKPQACKAVTVHGGWQLVTVKTTEGACGGWYCGGDVESEDLGGRDALFTMAEELADAASCGDILALEPGSTGFGAFWLVRVSDEVNVASDDADFLEKHGFEEGEKYLIVEFLERIVGVTLASEDAEVKDDYVYKVAGVDCIGVQSIRMGHDMCGGHPN